MRFKTWYDYFIVFTIFIKIVYIILTSLAIYYAVTTNINDIKNKRESNSGTSNGGGGSNGNRDKRIQLLKKIDYWRDRVEFIFIANMAIILIYLFYPGKEKQRVIDSEARLLLFSYGTLIILTAKWDIFFKESSWFEYLQEILGKSFFENNPNNFSADITNAHNIINNNIETIANMNQFYDSKKQQEKSQHNDSYQRYYTNIYTPETIGQYVYKPVAVPVNVNMGQIKSAI